MKILAVTVLLCIVHLSEQQFGDLFSAFSNGLQNASSTFGSALTGNFAPLQNELSNGAQTFLDAGQQALSGNFSDLGLDSSALPISLDQLTNLTGSGFDPSILTNFLGPLTNLTGSGFDPSTLTNPLGQLTNLTGSGFDPSTLTNPLGQLTNLTGSGFDPSTLTNFFGQLTNLTGSGLDLSALTNPLGQLTNVSNPFTDLLNLGTSLSNNLTPEDLARLSQIAQDPVTLEKLQECLENLVNETLYPQRTECENVGGHYCEETQKCYAVLESSRNATGHAFAVIRCPNIIENSVLWDPINATHSIPTSCLGPLEGVNAWILTATQGNCDTVEVSGGNLIVTGRACSRGASYQVVCDVPLTTASTASSSGSAPTSFIGRIQNTLGSFLPANVDTILPIPGRKAKKARKAKARRSRKGKAAKSQ